MKHNTLNNPTKNIKKSSTARVNVYIEILALIQMLFCGLPAFGQSTSSVSSHRYNHVKATEPTNNTQILLLGTAGGPPLHKDRSEPSSVLIVDGRYYLIDCGIGTMRRLIRAGIRSDSIKTIFITHHHPDHDLGLVDVLANDYFEIGPADSTHPITIYGPPETKKLVKLAFDYIRIPYEVFSSEGIGPKKVASPFIVHENRHNGLVYRDDKIRVTVVENTHYRLMPAAKRKELKSFSYRIETPHGVIVFTGDTGPSDAVTRLAKGADVLVTEVLDRPTIDKHADEMPKKLLAHMRQEHLSEQEVGKLASKAQVGAVLLHHFVPAAGVAPTTFVAGVKKYYSGTVFAGSDLQRYCLSTRSDTRKNTPTLTLCH